MIKNIKFIIKIGKANIKINNNNKVNQNKINNNKIDNKAKKKIIIKKN